MMFEKFPRELGFPKRAVVFTEEEFLYNVNKNNTKNNVFTTIYSFDDMEFNNNRHKPVYESAVVNKVFFDLDDGNVHEGMLKLHNEFKKHNYKHAVFFSGKGYHIYLYITPDMINMQNTILRIQKHFEKKLNIILDKQTLGNLAQMGRVPNTYNLRRRRYCIPVTKNDIELSYDEIREKAKKQKFMFSFFGNALFPTDTFDVKPKKIEGNLALEDMNIKDCNIKLKNVPPCIKNIMENPNAGYRERGLLIIFLREKGYTLEECKLLLKSFLNKKKLLHSEHTERQSWRLYSNDRYMFPSCERLMEEEICPGKCKKYNKVVYI